MTVHVDRFLLFVILLVFVYAINFICTLLLLLFERLLNYLGFRLFRHFGFQDREPLDMRHEFFNSFNVTTCMMCIVFVLYWSFSFGGTL